MARARKLSSSKSILDSTATPAGESPFAKGLLRKASILDCALKLASRHGIEGLTIGELAKEVGMSKSGLFAHFGGRDQLQLAVLKLATQSFIDVVMKPAFRQTRGAPRLRALFKNWVEHMNDQDTLPGGSLLIAASTELDDRPGLLRDYVQSAQKDLISNIEKAAKLAIEEKHFRADLDVEQFAWSLYSFVLGYHHFKRMLQDPKAELRLKRSFEALMSIAQSKEARGKAMRAVSPKLRAASVDGPRSVNLGTSDLVQKPRPSKSSRVALRTPDLGSKKKLKK